MIFPAPKRFITGFSVKSVDIGAIIPRCPTRIGERLSNDNILYRHQQGLNAQAYRIRYTNQRICVYFADDHGLLYAHNALNQLMDVNATLKNDFVIEDWPDFENRTILLDISRDRVPTLDSLKRLIDYWVQLKFNQLQLYTEHTFAYRNHETVWHNYSPMTAEDIQLIDAYCQEKGIELIPNQACFGHMEKWLNHEEYHYLAEQTTGFHDQRGDYRQGAFGLNPVSDRTTQFIDGLLTELLPNFSSKTLNINFDETMDLGVGASKSACEIFGKGKVFLEYLNTILALAEQKGMKCQIFSDMLFRFPNLISELHKDLTLLNWGYEADHPFDAEHRQLADFGLPFHVAVSTDCFASVAGRWSAATTHMRRAANSAKRYHAQGYMVTEWGDMGHGQQFSMPIPAYAFGAAMAWGEAQQTDNDVSAAVSWFFPDASEAEKHALIAIQNIYQTTGITVPNCAFFGPFLFDQASRRHIKRAEGLDNHNLADAYRELEELKSQLLPYASSPLADDLLWTIDALTLACHIAQGYAEEGHREVEHFSEERKATLIRALDPLIKQYEVLWTLHYREGGKQQSSQRLAYLHDLLQRLPQKAKEMEVS
ncbi:family 20 glycosylhydrolase [Enterovibrio sp. ZSDZ35]|uniref:beta-N-acetylhexosaminidase n=1 Tax=Enterovibrio qingdaonensis TaxID=2899818 RepID=A0ABT5QJ70_9GAMM|nr:family 20 glycosylhydrolase [Enterovibrio sp. ZSDZ35]MDD1781018.1 family 20 glycosylhydrolase [Enterovibrio sp. ZSDZ35]